MRYLKIFFILLIAFILISCFIPERRLYFTWNRPAKQTDPCNYEFNTSSNMNLIETQRGTMLDTDKEIYYRLNEEKPYNVEDYVYVMNEVISFMSNNKSCILIVEGHADIIGQGNGDINFKLSQRRASVIRDVILSYGFSYKRVKIFPYSDIMPKYTNDIYKNRRVNFIALKCERDLDKYIKYYDNVTNQLSYMEK
ncbi:OmpA family protein [Brachyspira hampsonii]|uniref:OmpA family protein n=1 Tax=Brachyspira hampsonii TaxID=1287055 RepID=UPI000D3D8CFF|nr:OmpA family protein [Brachyspira hampsonii]PTY40313.1 flagellar motor protein MotB [Brachyspira hampsonii bv. II]